MNCSFMGHRTEQKTNQRKCMRRQSSLLQVAGGALWDSATGEILSHRLRRLCHGGREFVMGCEISTWRGRLCNTARRLCHGGDSVMWHRQGWNPIKLAYSLSIQLTQWALNVPRLWRISSAEWSVGLAGMTVKTWHWSTAWLYLPVPCT